MRWWCTLPPTYYDMNIFRTSQQQLKALPVDCCLVIAVALSGAQCRWCSAGQPR